eukprot:TRINITY_DN26947_c0_g1_i1.p1 TRINITY_DN26947_c0_g1~~TRINITY_DN26947_c0_g1_i1.p1  ORF type:complete len:473 (+),score=62.54 TRINITY_DN26947_c0_g1_i1:94-1512(+)
MPSLFDGLPHNVSFGTLKLHLNSHPQRSLVLFLLACATLLLDESDLVVVGMGAACYWLCQRASRKVKLKKIPKDVSYDDDVTEECTSSFDRVNPTLAADVFKMGRRPIISAAAAGPKAYSFQRSVLPIAPVKLNSVGFAEQVRELLQHIKPSHGSEVVVCEIARIVQRSINSLMPEATTRGYASVNPFSAKAFAVAIPEVDIVIGVPANIMKKRMPCDRLTSRQVVKGVLRSCTDALVAAGFKFRRSAFQTDEPKVVLLATPSMGLADEPVALNVFVNASSPSRFMALVEACANLDVRARELILLVRRWARDRGVSYASQGTFSPYVWTLLTVFFLQVRMEDDGPLLPPMTTKDGVLKTHMRATARLAEEQQSSADLLREFYIFYHSFDWRTEVVSVAEGTRKRRNSPVTLPVIVDPFDCTSKLTDNLTEEGLSRVQEEVARAHVLLASSPSASLADLLAVWAPPASCHGPN